MTRTLKRPNPVLKGKYITYHYCPACKVIHTVVRSTAEPIILSRPIQEGDRVDGDMFTPWYCR